MTLKLIEIIEAQSNIVQFPIMILQSKSNLSTTNKQRSEIWRYNKKQN